MFSNGVIFLAAIASILIIVFNGDISTLIPLYAFGVFTGFTLSQTGMVRHHLKAQGTATGESAWSSTPSARSRPA